MTELETYERSHDFLGRQGLMAFGSLGIDAAEIEASLNETLQELGA